MSRRTLITLAIAFTVVAFVAAEADFWRGHHSGRPDHYYSNLLTSFGASHRGEIELDEGQTTIVAMSPDAFLEISERRFLTRRRLVVEADAAGRPRFELTVGSRTRSEAQAREFLADVMPEIVRSTTIGARARAARLLASEGLDALLGELSFLHSNAARQIYLSEAAAFEDLTEEQGRQIVRTAGREISSSSRLRSSLALLSEELPRDWRLTDDLVVAAERIASSSEKAAALVEIVRQRGLEIEEAGTLREALETVGSSSERGRAIARVARLESAPEVLEELVEAAGTIESSSERRRVLEELIDFPGLTAGVHVAALEAGKGIASSSEKASFLVALANVLQAEGDLQQSYLQVASSIAASSERARALLGLLRAADLSAALCTSWIKAAGSVASSSVAADLLTEAATECPSDEEVWRAYLAEARRVAASSEQHRTLMALLERDDLDDGIIEAVSLAAEESIAASSERQVVIDRARQLLTAGSTAEPPEGVPEGPSTEAESEPQASAWSG